MSTDTLAVSRDLWINVAGLRIHCLTAGTGGRPAALANDSLPGAVSMAQIAALSEREIALVPQHIKANDPQEMQKLDEELRENHEKLRAHFKTYEATLIGAEKTELFQKLENDYAAYLTPLEEVLKLSRAQKNKEASDLYDQQLEPMFRKFLDGINDDAAYNKKVATPPS